MTEIYRARSESRDDDTKPDWDYDTVANDVDTLNQAAQAFSTTADWVVQTGTVTWKEI